MPRSKHSRPRRAFLLLATTLLALPVALATSGDAPKAGPADLAFLEGTWEGDMWGGKFRAVYAVEEWIALSYSELRKEGKVAFHEFERFALAEGKLVFTPYPGGQPSVPFALASFDKKGRKVVFENPKKDFPTRIEFHRAADDRLAITLTDPTREGSETEVFDLKRVK